MWVNKRGVCSPDCDCSVLRSQQASTLQFAARRQPFGSFAQGSGLDMSASTAANAEIPVEDLERHSSNGEGAFEDASSDTSMLGAIDRLNLMRAIRKLPAGCKKLFLMHGVIGYEHSEIAGLLGCSIGCSKSQVHKARKKLRRLLQGEHRRGEAGVAPTW